MNTPGFTAEASLYKTAGNYRMKGAGPRVNGDIRPAAYPRLAVPYDPSFRLEPIIAQYLATVACCRDCASECNSKCRDQSCVEYCLNNTCNPRCDAYGYGGCKQLL